MEPAPIHVVATDVAGTREAIATATALAGVAAVRVHVIAAQPPPSTRSPDQQSATVQALAKEIRLLTEGSRIPIEIFACVCRHLMDVTQLIPARAVVVIAGHTRRWWPSQEQRLAADLNRLGYRVTFIPRP